MDSRKNMLLVNGQDKTDSVASFRFQDGMCEVIYANSPKRLSLPCRKSTASEGTKPDYSLRFHHYC